jgi:hypothetical protein
MAYVLLLEFVCPPSGIQKKKKKTLYAALTAFVSISGFSISLHAQAPTPTATDREYAPPPLRIPTARGPRATN